MSSFTRVHWLFGGENKSSNDQISGMFHQLGGSLRPRNEMPGTLFGYIIKCIVTVTCGADTW